MQGFNMGRYHAPAAADPALSGGDHHHHHPHHHDRHHRSRGAAAAPTVRFEMPFAVWCGHCAAPTLIGQGVRFNAEKRRAGSYHSTPVWAFRLRHGACGGWIEMRTDPQHAEFVVVSGARRRDYGGEEQEEDSLVRNGVGAIATTTTTTTTTTTERERTAAAEEMRRQSAFGKLEKTIADREQLVQAGRRIGELRHVADGQWDDPYAQNQRLRKAFRAGRHERERAAAKAEALKEKMGLGIELLPENELDARIAALVDFGTAALADDDTGMDKALARPLFGVGTAPKGGKRDPGELARGLRKLKSEVAASRTRENLVSEIVTNTRAAKDPFLDFGSRESTPRGPARLLGVKRKRPAEEAPDPDPPPTVAEDQGAPKAAAGSTALVSYDSDSD